MKLEVIDKPDALFWASFNCFELRIPGAAVADIARPGDAAEAVDYWIPRITRYEWGEGHTWAPTPERIRKELREYGAWDDNELADDAANWRRIVWLAACNINEDDAPDCSEPVNQPATT